MRIYTELPCGCLVSEDGGGALIPCCYPEVGGEESELHKICMELYFEKHKSVEEIQNFVEEKGLWKRKKIGTNGTKSGKKTGKTRKSGKVWYCTPPHR